MIDKIFRLDKKVIVVTGSSGLLGSKHSEAIASQGGNLVLIDIDVEKSNEIASKLEMEHGIKVLPLEVDITNEKAIEGAQKKILKEFGRIDGLVNNACNNPKVEEGKKNFNRLENLSLEEWNKDLSVGITGAFLCSKFFGSEIANNSSGGSIVNISSDLGLIAPDQSLYFEEGLKEEDQFVKPISYSVVKTGIIGLTRYLSTYWAKENVRCNAICPGGVENNQSPDFLKKISLRIPLGRMASSDEYKGILIFMLSNASSYLNGAIIPVDGGRTVW